MSIVKVDAKGCACPEPVLKVKQAMSKSDGCVEVLVDNNTAVQNIKRFANSRGCTVNVTENDGEFQLIITNNNMVNK